MQKPLLQTRYRMSHGEDEPVSSVPPPQPDDAEEILQLKARMRELERAEADAYALTRKISEAIRTRSTPSMPAVVATQSE